MPTLSPAFSPANGFGSDFFLQVLVTGIVTNHTQKIPSQVYIALSKGANLSMGAKSGEDGVYNPATSPHYFSWKWKILHAGARVVDLGGPSVYQGGPKFEIKPKTAVLERVSLLIEGAKHVPPFNPMAPTLD